MVNVGGNVLAVGVRDFGGRSGAEGEVILKRSGISIDRVWRQPKVRLDFNPFPGHGMAGDSWISFPSKFHYR
jgi:hypothetical protein